MSETNKTKSPSALVQAVLALDNHFADLLRLSEKIESLDMKSDFDFEQAQRFINLFTESGQGVSDQVVLLAKALNEARAQAEATAQIVSAKAELLANRKAEQQVKMEQFRQLGEKVRVLTSSLNELKRPEGQAANDEDRAKISMRLSEFEIQLQPLIEEAQHLKKQGQTAKLKVLEQGADALGQSLVAISQKLSVYNQASGPLV